MALFKILKGQKTNLPLSKVEGYAYVTTDEHKFYVDISNSERICLNADTADKLAIGNGASNQAITGGTNGIKWTNIAPAAEWTNYAATGPSLKISVLGATSQEAIIPLANTEHSGAVSVGQQEFRGNKIFSQKDTIKFSTGAKPYLVNKELTWDATGDRYWVILLLPELTAANQNVNNFLDGHFIFYKVNADRYNSVDLTVSCCYNKLCYYLQSHGEDGTFELCKVVYNNIKYIALKVPNNNYSRAAFMGHVYSTLDGGNEGANFPLDLPYSLYYKTNDTVNNTEVNNSITTELVSNYITSAQRYKLHLWADGANITNLNASYLATGTVPLERLPSIPASLITSGILGVPRGGTGNGTWTKNQVVLTNASDGAGALTSRAYNDSSSASALGTSTNFVTERDIYYGLPTINNAHNYNSSTTIYAPTAGGTADTHALVGAGITTAPKWVAIDPTITITGGTTAGPSIKIGVLGRSSTDAVIPSASASASGVVTTGAQSFAGAKTFGDITISGTTDTAKRTISSASTLYLNSAASTSFIIQKGGTNKWRYNADGTAIHPETTNQISLGISGQRWSKLFVGTADSYGSAYKPIWWSNGVPVAVTDNSLIVNLASTSGDSVFAQNPRPGITGTLGIAHGGTGATTAAGALVALIGSTAIGGAKQPIYWDGTAFKAANAYSTLFQTFTSSGNTLTIKIGDTEKTASIINSLSLDSTAGTGSASQILTMKVNGQSAASVSLTKATTGVYGATKLTASYTSSDSTLAATGAAILAAIQTLDVASVGGTGKYISAISETDGKISATVSNTAVTNAWTAGTTAGPSIKTTVNGVNSNDAVIPSASASASGVVTTGAQTFAGEKTFNTMIKGTIQYAMGLTQLGRRASADYNPSNETYPFRITAMLASSTMTTNHPGIEGMILNFPWDWGAYNGQLAILSTSTTPRMRIRSAGHVDNGADASPRYTPNYGAWREIVTSTKDTQIGSGIIPVYIANNGQATASNSTVGSSIKPIFLNAGTLTVSSSTVGSARQAVYLNAGTITAGNYTVAHYGNAGKSNMNDVGRMHASSGMTNLSSTSNVDTPMCGDTYRTGWHLYWSTNYTDDPNGSNAWVAQIINRAGTSEWWVRSRNGGTITNGTAWASGWRHLVTSAQAGVGNAGLPVYIANNGDAIVCTAANLFNTIRDNGGDNRWVTLTTAQTISAHKIFYTPTAGNNAYADGSAIEIREVNLQTTNQSDWTYAPKIGFHWGSRYQGTIGLHSNGQFYFGISGGTSNVTVNTGTLQANGHVKANAGYLYSTLNGNTVTIGSQNSSYCHFSNSANIPFWFNKVIHSDGGFTIYNTGNNHWRNGYLQINKSDGGDCYLALLRAGNADWRILNSGGNLYFQNNWTSAKGSYFNVLTLDYNTGRAHFKEYVYASYYNASCGVETPQDGSYWIYANSDGFFRKSSRANAVAKLDLEHKWVRVAGDTMTGTLRMKASTGNYTEGIRIYPYSSWATLMLLGADTTADNGTSANSWGLFNNNGNFYINKNASSGATNSRAWATSTGWTFGNTTRNSYALNCASFICDSWVRTVGATGWYNESYGGGWYMSDSTYIRNYNSKHVYITGRLGVDCELRLWSNTRQMTRDGRSVSWINGRDSALVRESTSTGWHAVVSVKAASGSWNIGEYNTSGWANYLVFSYDTDANYNAGTNSSTTIRFRNNGVVESAMWNDYAECRSTAIKEPGRVVYETKEKIMQLANERLMPGCRIISDTFGFLIGTKENCDTPIAVSGRVLVYPYQDRENYTLGAAVCSAPNGTVDLMTREEIMMYPERIIGTVSEIPDYETWEGGGVLTNDGQPIPVNGRIWIYVR